MAKTLLSSFMEAANILMIDGLSDKDKVEKIRNPVLLESVEENKESFAHGEQVGILDEMESEETKFEESNPLNIDGMSCDSCNFKTIAKSKHNQMSALNRHKRNAHGEHNAGLAEIIVEKREESSIRENLPNEAGLSCTICGFVSTAKSKNNQTSVMKTHKKTVHGEDGDRPTTEIVVPEEQDIVEIISEESNVSNEDNLSCTICGFVTTAKSKNNQLSVMGRHNRKVHGNGEYADIHLSQNSEPDTKEEEMITLDEDSKETPPDITEESSSDDTEESSCDICGFKSVAKTKWNRSTVLKRHISTVHESKSGETITS